MTINFLRHGDGVSYLSLTRIRILIFLDKELDFLTFPQHGAGFFYCLSTQSWILTFHRHRDEFLFVINTKPDSHFIDTELDSSFLLWHGAKFSFHQPGVGFFISSSTRSCILYFHDTESNSLFCSTESWILISSTWSQILHFHNTESDSSISYQHGSKFFFFNFINTESNLFISSIGS